MTYKDEVLTRTKLSCGTWGRSLLVTFESFPGGSESGVQITVGDSTSMISRQELVAAAMLFSKGLSRIDTRP